MTAVALIDGDPSAGAAARGARRDDEAAATAARRPRAVALTLALAFSLAPACAAPSDAPALATEIVAAPGATGEGFGDPALAVNGVRGGGTAAGSTDAYSLDFGAGSTLVLGFGGRRVLDGPGADLVVFENAFVIGAGPARFMDLAVVSVSADGETWLDLPHDYVAEDETRYSNDPADWPGFAGRTPVLLHAESNPVDPFDTALAGGDAFDLAELGDGAEALRVRHEGARFVRLTAAPALTNPDTGAPYVRDATANGADVDGVVARWLE